tara:strand:- start:958 stop:2025 length:1068 start_codon:yes stop_codon:yes gene_type:complete
VKKIMTIIGARPQFVKASVVSRVLRDVSGVSEMVVHTGQHFDDNMSKIFFEQLSMPKPELNLNIHGESHGKMTGEMLIKLEDVLLDKRPDLVLLYGDTNTTLAGALAASKLNIEIAHVESGLRSFNKNMPEEINRVVTDNLSSFLFCPSDLSVQNLICEGFEGEGHGSIHLTGDVMLDAKIAFEPFMRPPKFFQETGCKDFLLFTCHRAENTNNDERLIKIFAELNFLHQNFKKVIMPIHPRTRKKIELLGIVVEFYIVEPVGYLEMLYLLDKASLVITDSGGVQKEAFFFKKPCLILRKETEWKEIIGFGCELVSDDESSLTSLAENIFKTPVENFDRFYGSGDAAEKIASVLM